MSTGTRSNNSSSSAADARRLNSGYNRLTNSKALNSSPLRYWSSSRSLLMDVNILSSTASVSTMVTSLVNRHWLTSLLWLVPRITGSTKFSLFSRNHLCRTIFLGPICPPSLASFLREMANRSSLRCRGVAAKCRLLNSMASSTLMYLASARWALLVGLGKARLRAA